MVTVTREQLQSIEWTITSITGDAMCLVCRKKKQDGHRPDCWLAAALACPQCGCGRPTTPDREYTKGLFVCEVCALEQELDACQQYMTALASPPAEDVQFARDVHMLARRIVVRPERAAELAPHLMRLAERRGALAPGVLRDDEWTPASALSKAYPPSGMIEPGDVIEFAHGNDAPMLQRLTHPAAVEDWNGKLRDRVRQVYTPKAQAPPASDPPGLVEVVRSWQEARTARRELFKKWEGDEYGPAPFDEVSSISFRMDEATKALDAYPLPASPQAETKGDE
jgi:hypothetical protein